MARFRVAVGLLATWTLGLWASGGMAQEAAAPPGSSQKLILGYRMQAWKTDHMHDAQAAATQVQTLRKLGCEVKSAQHDGHSDVQFRTVYWKSLALDAPQQLEQWKAWLQAAGFEVVHALPAGTSNSATAQGQVLEVVQYRLADWRTRHVHQPAEVGQLTTLYRTLGCELEQATHDGHTDLRYRCPQWMEIELPTHEVAHKWQQFLNTAGFETKHEH